MAIAWAILGHHSGLHDFADLKDQLKDPALNPLESSSALIARLDQERHGNKTPWHEPLRDFLRFSGSGKLG